MTRHRPVPNPAADFQPMVEINTTPLIDLMLVLLILFLVTIPVATHKVPIDLPQGVPPVTSDPAVHRLALDEAGALSWDGRAIRDVELPRLLAALRADPRAPVLEFSAEGETRYERFDQTLATVRRAGIERLGFVGNERFAQTL